MKDRHRPGRQQARRDRAAYFTAYHAARREARNAARRRRYAATHSRAAVAAYRARRAAEVEARLLAAVAAELERSRGNAELTALIAEQARDARTYRIKHGPDFLDVSPARLVA